MDREQEEMQFLGLFGIYKEAYKIMNSWRKLLGQISLVLILPLSVIFLVHMQVSEVLSSKILHNEIVLGDTRAGSPTYNKVSDVLSSEWIFFWLFNAAYFTILLILSLLSTSAVVYTVACIYTGREVDFKKVMSVVPKVWKRLMATFLCSFLFFLVYHILFFVTIVICILGFGSTKAIFPILDVLKILFLVGFVYMSIVWQLASVVTVLEDTFGFGAIPSYFNLDARHVANEKSNGEKQSHIEMYFIPTPSAISLANPQPIHHHPWQRSHLKFYLETRQLYPSQIVKMDYSIDSILHDYMQILQHQLINIPVGMKRQGRQVKTSMR